MRKIEDLSSGKQHLIVETINIIVRRKSRLGLMSYLY
jgi:hypothetical protein